MLPQKLNIGDQIEVVSTARKMDVAALQYAVSLFESWGLLVKLGDNIYKEHHQFCGTDAERKSDLQTAIDDPETKAIICFRGGYGTVRIIDDIDFSALLNHPKWICGYSDITVLHNALANIGIPSLHTTMPINFESNSKQALASLRNALMESEMETVAITPHKMNIFGSCEGKIVGGNLSILYSLSGTKYDIDTSNCILFIEDLDEYLYHVDRMMYNLKLSGKLANLKALIVGGMTGMNDNDTPFGQDAIQIIYNAVAEYQYPVCFGFPAGHIDDNRCIILGDTATLSVSETEVLFAQ